jgi:hypothetical protein
MYESIGKLNPSNTTRMHFVACTMILLMAALFLLAALYNGFPFVYPDTGGYLGAYGIMGTPMRTPYYTIFNRLVDLHISLWPTVILQSLMAAWMIWRSSSALFGIYGPLRLLALAVFLTFGTSLPWFVGWIMPDIFTSFMIIALALLGFAPEEIPRPSRIILMLLIGTAVAVHQANLPVALWTLPAVGLCALMGWRPPKAFFNGLFAIGLGLTLGIAALAAANLYSGHFGLSSGGSVFLLSRLLGDGTAISYLERVCPQQRFHVCTQLDELKAFNSLHPNIPLKDYFLWGGPLDKLGGFRAEEAEATTIVVGTLSKYPAAQLRASVGDAWKQLLLFATGEELYAFPDAEPASYGVRVTFGPAVYNNYRNSKQVLGILPIEYINHIHFIIFIFALCALVGFITIVPTKRGYRPFYAAIFVIFLVMGNAFTLGVLSGPYSRYQARVIWLVPFLAACFLLAPRRAAAQC